MSWRPATTAIDGPVAKLGGQPHWLDQPFWPVSRSTGEPMTFVGQFPLPGPDIAMAYLFVSDEDGTYLPDGGENALLIQPGGRIPPFVTGSLQPTGPALWRRGASWTDRVPVELHLDLTPPDEESATAYEQRLAYLDAERRDLPIDDDADPPWVENRSYVGGEPLVWQPWTPPALDVSWRFFFQLDGAEGVDDDAFALNFGGGTGYAYLSADGREGRFYWDCV